MPIQRLLENIRTLHEDLIWYHDIIFNANQPLPNIPHTELLLRAKESLGRLLSDERNFHAYNALSRLKLVIERTNGISEQDYLAIFEGEKPFYIHNDFASSFDTEFYLDLTREQGYKTKRRTKILFLRTSRAKRIPQFHAF